MTRTPAAMLLNWDFTARWFALFRGVDHRRTEQRRNKPRVCGLLLSLSVSIIRWPLRRCVAPGAPEHSSRRRLLRWTASGTSLKPKRLVTFVASELLALAGVGVEIAGQLLVTSGAGRPCLLNRHENRTCVSLPTRHSHLDGGLRVEGV
jgi:hypothetical protein